ncbi:uncharacterized protein LOC123722602 [Papilio machaon]|uniref:uncharacterized protein LOC123722602 n=1 Tax=Papilio machaon TaxID=76193 RepID=UPI001E662F19|nr:uncharacterized protein LOC123722602 [Papilio machaon]
MAALMTRSVVDLTHWIIPQVNSRLSDAQHGFRKGRNTEIIKNSDDCLRLQRDIDSVLQWSKDNKLFFNVNKCCVISYSRARAPLHHPYVLDTSLVPRVSHVRDLGVEMVEELNFRNHIANICRKSFRNLGFIIRQCKNFENALVIKVLYNALVRSHLETSSSIWSPHEKKYTLMVERIQNKFTRFLYYKQYGVYPCFPLMYPSLFVNGMVGYSTLRVRRDVALVRSVWRVLRGAVCRPAVLAALRLRVPDCVVQVRRRPPLFLEPTARTNLLENAPIVRAIRLLNIVSRDIDIFSCSEPKFTEAAYRCVEDV